MSDEGGVTPADMVRDIMMGYGNSVPVQRGSGHLVAPGVAGHRRAGEQWSALGSKPQSDRVYVSQHLSFALFGKATRGKPRSEPDWGNPTVRDRRGACGNVNQGGTRNPRHNRKGACRKLSAYRCARRTSTRPKVVMTPKASP
jgi:hypothetical protein